MKKCYKTKEKGYKTLPNVNYTASQSTTFLS